MAFLDMAPGGTFPQVEARIGLLCLGFGLFLTLQYFWTYAAFPEGPK